MSLPDVPFAAHRRAIQVVEHHAVEVNSAHRCASTGSNTKPSPSPHLEPINKILASMSKRNIEAETDEDEEMIVSVKQGKTLVLPNDSSVPRDSWRVLLPIIQEKMNTARSRLDIIPSFQSPTGSVEKRRLLPPYHCSFYPRDREHLLRHYSSRINCITCTGTYSWSVSDISSLSAAPNTSH